MRALGPGVVQMTAQRKADEMDDAKVRGHPESFTLAVRRSCCRHETDSRATQANMRTNNDRTL